MHSDHFEKEPHKVQRETEKRPNDKKYFLLKRTIHTYLARYVADDNKTIHTQKNTTMLIKTAIVMITCSS